MRRLDPEVAAAVMRAAGLEPLEPYPGAGVQWSALCLTCGGTTFSRYSYVRRYGSGCASCGARRANAPRRLDPAKAASDMIAAGIQPLEPFQTVMTDWRCQCMICGREVITRHNRIQQGVGGCKWCAQRAVPEAEAIAAMQAAGAQPLEPFPGTNKAWRCQCNQCGREVRPWLLSVNAGRGPCRYCADRSYWSKGESLAIVYLLVNEHWNAVKVGIMRADTHRLTEHRRHGWTVIETWERLTPETAYAAEQSVLSMWRTKGIPDAVAAENMPQSGHTETAPLDLVDLAHVRDVINGVIAAAAVGLVNDVGPVE